MATLMELMERLEQAARAGAQTVDLFTCSGTTVYADFQAGKKTGPDYVLYQRDGDLFGLGDRFSWVKLVDTVRDLDDLAQTRVMAGTVWGDLDVSAMRFVGAVKRRRREEWLAAARLVQAIIIQEQFNYPAHNGWWWTFHVFRCIGCGCPPEVVRRQVGSSASYLPSPDRCAECTRCDLRPWGNPPRRSTDLRAFYQAEGKLTLREDLLAAMLS